MASLKKSAHILVFPYPAQGHMLPLLDLTHYLATHGVTITILVTPKNLPILTPLLSSSPNIHPLVLPFPPHPSLPAGVENVKDIGNHGNVPIINSLAKLRDPIIQWFTSHRNPPVAIVSDFFLGWTHHLADELGIRRICFFSSGAFLIGVLEYTYRNTSFDDRPQSTTVFHDLPDSPSFAPNHLPTLIRAHNVSDTEWKFVDDCHVMNALSWGWVVNTFDALESRYMEYLKKLMGHEKVYEVGPVSLLNGSDLMTREKSKPKQPDLGFDNDVIRWLDGKSDGSVVYVCFGSQKFLTNDQMKALVIGLEDSGISYVLVVKSEQGGLVRSGLGRGFVIKGWAPQRAILSHKAMGGFLSHCGWNSVLEAILNGVMILAWPMEADQYVNARLLVEDHGVAVRVCEGPDTVPDSAQLARIIAESMSGDKIEKLKAKELKQKAIEAIKEGGSSSMHLERLIKELSNLNSN